jgi:hypothetical protein
MDVRDQLHAAVALSLGGEAMVPLMSEVLQVPEPM